MALRLSRSPLPPRRLAGEQAIWAKGVAFLAAGLDARQKLCLRKTGLAIEWS